MNLSSHRCATLFTVGIALFIFDIYVSRANASSSPLRNYVDGYRIENVTASAATIYSVGNEQNPSTMTKSKSKLGLGLELKDESLSLGPSNDSTLSRAVFLKSDTDKWRHMTERGYKHNKQTYLRKMKEKARRTSKFFHSSSSSQVTYQDDDADADADDYSSAGGNTEDLAALLKYHDETLFKGKDQPTSSKSTQWYMLSYYISPESIIYDIIQGFLVGTLICLILATCYSYTYYCFLVRCGLCLDDRLDTSILNTKARKRKRIPIPNRRKARSGGRRKDGWCSFLWCFRNWMGSGGYDGKGFFVPVDTHNDIDSSEDSSSDGEDEVVHSGVYVYKENEDHSSLSDSSSKLTLEYGDEHLHDEYGEMTNRMNDAKVKIAAKEYFDKEELESAKKVKQRSRRRNPTSREERSHRSRRSERSHRSRKSAGTQTSSILSSSSEHSSTSSSDSDGNVTLEMLEAMTDLKKVEQKGKRSDDI